MAKINVIEPSFTLFCAFSAISLRDIKKSSLQYKDIYGNRAIIIRSWLETALEY